MMTMLRYLSLQSLDKEQIDLLEDSRINLIYGRYPSALELAILKDNYEIVKLMFPKIKSESLKLKVMTYLNHKSNLELEGIGALAKNHE